MRSKAHKTTLVLFLVAGLVATLPGFAQIPTGTITGKVQTEDTRLPGVVVTATSDALQGERSTVTGNDGTYKLAFLPPGSYDLKFELNDFNTVEVRIQVNAVQSETVNVAMSVAGVEETLIVIGSLETISESATISTTVQQDELEQLPIARSIRAAVELVPGVHATGPTRTGTRAGNISINGAMSFENLWLINGIVINENVRGQALNLFIEDAILEHNVSIGNVSAEYGRFTGGVINVVTKSGGNDFHGSLRANITNDDWTSDTPLTVNPAEDKTNETFEATLGGRILTDRIWFFLAGRDRELDQIEQTSVTNIPYSLQDEQDRTEAKLTVNLTQSHTLTGSYLEVNQATVNDSFGDILDLNTLVTRTDPQDITAINYHGVFGNSFFAEAQYSARNLDNGVGAGGTRDLFSAPWEDTGVGGSSNWGQPTFCGECEQESRDNENALVKGSYFLSTEGAGSHDISFGYDTFNDRTFDVNHQSGSDFRLSANGFLIDPDTKEVFTVVDPASSSQWVTVWPIFGLENVQKTAFKTNSFFVNDRWQLNDHWSFNVGLRLDENDGRDAGNTKVVDDDKLSPRLGLSYDVKGDGDLVLNASYGEYVAAIANNIADTAATGGALGLAVLFYGGPPINLDPNCVGRGDCISTVDATRMVVNWWIDTTGFNPLTSPPEDIARIPGALFLEVPGTESNRGIRDTLKSPSTEEITIGVTKRLGSRGLVRADLVYRDWEDFYSHRIVANDQVLVEGVELDFEEIGNFGDDVLERDYLGVNIQARYRFNRLTLAGNYTWSELEGNIDGETSLNGPISDDPFRYREYRGFANNRPVGPLGADQEHKLRAWAIYDIFRGERNHLNVSLLQSFFSGTPYSASGSVDSRPFVTNPGYVSPDASLDYFFTRRGVFKTDDVNRTDLALNYTFRVGKGFEIFFQPEILNVFDDDATIDVDSRILDAESDPGTFSTFNPFTETPVEGTHWAKHEEFGKPQNELDFQLPRTYRFSIGFRF